MKLFILQPFLYSYRKSVFDSLSCSCDIVLAAEKHVDIDNLTQFRFIQSKLIRLPFGFHYQTKILNYRLIKSSDFIWIPLDLSNISYFLVFIISIISGRKVLFHTQGNYKHRDYSLFKELLLKIILPLAKTTFYYSDSCFVSPFSDIVHRYHILNNRYECLPVPQYFSPEFSQTPNLLFIGRLRKKSGILLACSVIDKLVKDKFNVTFHIIGNGPHFSNICRQYSHLIESKNIIMHGSINEYDQITTIAKNCSIGLYLGDAGLSVLHYMSLGLCPIVHDNMTSHNGPEPSYLVDNINSKLVDNRDIVNSTTFAIQYLLNDRLELQRLQKTAFADAQSLHVINMSNEILSTLSRL